ncbi:hypothetical protein [Enterococcus sp. HY326]|uniref:hypothetical protein n=1 Tax=Enterococcus sp. HY326 TaxID=2971265 RepID=UPI0022401166|nr:hypothetical protein [Enterococcus sp. HY326]
MKSEKIPMKAELFTANDVFFTEEVLTGEQVLRVTKNPEILADDEATFAQFATDFKDGTIEVDVLSRLLPDAPEHARGFIGLALRIDDQKNFEGIYVRPTNGRAKNQLRRNRAVQYFSYPEYKFDRFRAENPGEYETYADIDIDQWIHLKIVVKGTTAELFINNAQQPSFIVVDLKHGENQHGAIGLWVDLGTEGFFKNLVVSN